MTVTQVDARPHVTAILAALNVKLSPNKAYTLDAVPGTKQNYTESERTKPLPNLYAEVNLEPRYVDPRGTVPRASRGGWRVTVVCVGRSINETAWVADRVNQALRNQRLTVAGERTHPVLLESSQGPEWDNVRWSSQLLYTYGS